MCGDGELWIPSPSSSPTSSQTPSTSPGGGEGGSGEGDLRVGAASAFLAACARGDAAAVSKTLRATPAPLIRRLLTEKEEPSGRSPLHLAARAGSLPAVQLLLEWGAPPNARDGAQRTPLCTAARARSDIVGVLVGALLAGGASPTHADARGRTALHHAALAANVEAVSQLLSWGAAPNSADAEGATPLDLAERADGVAPRAMFKMRELLQGGVDRGGRRRLVLREAGPPPPPQNTAAAPAPAAAVAPQAPTSSRRSRLEPSVGASV